VILRVIKHFQTTDYENLKTKLRPEYRRRRKRDKELVQMVEQASRSACEPTEAGVGRYPDYFHEIARRRYSTASAR
jgi:hypothetical protein